MCTWNIKGPSGKSEECVDNARRYTQTMKRGEMTQIKSLDFDFE